MDLEINYDKILNIVKLKFAVPVIVAKRAETLKNIDQLKGVSQKKDYVAIALKELEEGKIVLKK
ncbi:MAG: DNA-directed RNA polymerase subunit omega [Defluviitoga tunisiensis]|jgi:DNA-directed RNA polymerase subunit omega|uniref:DNA-directed RNA polymerase subunit omega n=1 Tax=Defluviitoga tunisiensis TaxID=1006576 RepID=A0A0C7NNC6_DEFTU|nr:DNA-directed RNA polymerase subunit omega [Defluviitoga tunisiensis]MDD3601482.1 DNA-directed RNA polymerase subunit omega [Defluviitoga tunisiensis]MDY0380006.1 DNA-directed RNA polymerase subunit omega [Defluviitoga tunisiensis]CEP77427.1 hypothetical protein DTL3_0093 [Defluviitoga tunisiensis]HHV00573.1 DNA-directed RNA polymerase subunit omega [Defluviitoga tunisiensis]HOB55967.1 DNA-directed RNA polymerase subunit omega [Defluviitoga tunisiensis]